jgi:hypothetical protein
VYGADADLGQVKGITETRVTDTGHFKGLQTATGGFGTQINEGCNIFIDAQVTEACDSSTTLQVANGTYLDYRKQACEIHARSCNTFAATTVSYQQTDITALHQWLPPVSVDKIVTDPPWGLYDAGEDIPALYETMFAQFGRVLANSGVIVLLTAQKELVRELLQDGRFNLNITQAYDVLVSGKKAGVFVIKQK